MPVIDTDEINISARRLKFRMKTDSSAKIGYWCGLKVGDSDNYMRDTGIDTLNMQGDILHGNGTMEEKVMRLRKLNPDVAPAYLRMNDSGTGFKGKRRAADLVFIRKPSGTTPSIAAHISLTAIGIEEAPAKVGLTRSLDQNEAVCSYSLLASTELGGN